MCNCRISHRQDLSNSCSHKSVKFIVIENWSVVYFFTFSCCFFVNVTVGYQMLFEGLTLAWIMQIKTHGPNKHLNEP